jgi:mevalonate kinase
MQSYYAHGKLLLTAEYTVLKGALALAVPTKLGQRMTVEINDRPGLHWQSLDANDKPWFTCQFTPELQIAEQSDLEKATFLQKLLKAATVLAGDVNQTTPLNVKTHLEFPNDWGLGSSSTLISLIAQLFSVDALKLFFEAAKGSGYDVACATATSPIFYQLNSLRHASVKSTVLSEAFHAAKFVHLNQKQRSLPEVKRFMQRETDRKLIDEISALTQTIAQTDDFKSLSNLFNQHELLTANAIGLSPVKQRLFPDFTGCIKSLGAWGGDFVLVMGDDTEDYFKTKGYQTILDFQEMILAYN